MPPFSLVSARFWGSLGRLRASSTRPKGLLELGARMATLAQALLAAADTQASSNGQQHRQEQ